MYGDAPYPFSSHERNTDVGKADGQVQIRTLNRKLGFQIKEIMQSQERRFLQMEEGCDFIEQTMSSLEETVGALEQKILALNQVENREAAFFSNLKNKQNELIIDEMKSKIKKIERSEEEKSIELIHIKREFDILKKEKIRAEEDSRLVGRLKKQANDLQVQLSRKQIQLQSLKKHLSQSQKGKTNKQEEEYRVLEDRLSEFEVEFEQKIESMQKELTAKDQQIKELRKELEHQKQLLCEQRLKFEHSSNVKLYELQLKYKRQSAQCLETEEEYNKLLVKSNNAEIALHQQIQSLKSSLNEEKAKSKKYTKKVVESLQGLASSINRRPFNHFTNSDVKQIVEELKSALQKEKGKQLQKQRMEMSLLEDEIEQLKSKETDKQKVYSKIRQSEERLREENSKLRKKIETLEESNTNIKDSIRNSNKRSSLNGSFAGSSKKSDSMSVYQEKFKEIIDTLRAEINLKQLKINQLEKIQASDFESSKEKILSLQSLVADAKNELKRSERTKKELQEDLQLTQKQIADLKESVQALHQSHKAQRQRLKNLYEEKALKSDQKYAKLKQSYNQLDSKAQEKVMKYNKMKGRVEKLELYNSETEKRKNLQIDDLVNKSQHLKFQNKSLKDKISLLQLNIESVSTQSPETANNKEGTPYNKDLVEQIQMERDRILEQYEQKRKEFLKIKTEKETLELQHCKINKKCQQYEAENRGLKKVKDEGQFNTKRTIKSLEYDKERLEQENQQLKGQLEGKRKEQYEHLKRQLQKSLTEKESLKQQIRKKKQELRKKDEHFKKIDAEKEQTKRESQSLQSQLQKLRFKMDDLRQESSKIKNKSEQKIKILELKLSQAAVKEENLINIINYKNCNPDNQDLRESMKGEELLLKLNSNIQSDTVGVEDLKDIVGNRISRKQSTESKVQSLHYVRLEDLCIQPQEAVSRKVKLGTSALEQIRIESEKPVGPKNDFEVNCSILDDADCLKQFICDKNLQLNFQTPSNNSQNNTQPQKTACESVGVMTQTQDPEQQQKVDRKSLNQDGSANNALFLLEDQMLGSYHDQHEDSVAQKGFEQNYKQIHEQTKQKRFSLEDAQRQKPVEVNLFQNLEHEINEADLDDNFEICEEGESINVGQTALNLQVKEIFNKLREELEKVFNGEEISLSMMRILPMHLSDDYNELISYIREKIEEIKNLNQLSFIMAEVGDEPEQIEDELDEELRSFVNKKLSEDLFTYRRLVEEKEALITSLMNERTEQENTINQMTMEKEEIEEENENRFMSQCNIYKKEVRELKKRLDSLEMDFQSMKNVFKNSMEIWADEDENEDDLRDNYVIYKKLARLSEVEATRLNYYLFRYREIKGVE